MSVGSRPWSFAAAALLGIAAILLALYFSLHSSGTLLVVAAALSTLSVLVFLAGRLMAPRATPSPLFSDRPSDPPFRSAATRDARAAARAAGGDRGAAAPAHPADDLSGAALEVAESLNARLDALSGTEKEQQQFIADVSHELRTPLTVLRGTLEVALEEERPVEEYREAIGNALLETRHLARISQNILFLTRGESGRVTLSFSNHGPGPVRLGGHPRSPAGRRRPWPGPAVEVPEAPVIRVRRISGRMQQVLHNLLENSMRYTPPGGTRARDSP